MHKKWTAAATAAILMLTGCTSATGYNALNDGEYAAILPYTTSDTRAKHIGLIADQDIRLQAEKGLMDLSKKYFDPNDVAYATHTFLDFDELDATDGSRGLLGTLRDDNPNGLNPNNNDTFDTGNGLVQGGIILVDLYELDWYKGDSLQGISISLVVNEALNDNGTRVEITDEAMKSYLEVTGSKLVSYMRERFNEISKNIPIFIAAYELNTDDTSNSKGGYAFEGWFPAGATMGEFTPVDEEYLVVPGTEFTATDPNLAAQFNTFKEDISMILSDNTYVTGECKFQGGLPVKLNLNVTAHGKTASEVLACTQAVRENLSVFTNGDVDYRVEIVNDNKTIALLHRPPKSKNVTVVTSL